MTSTDSSSSNRKIKILIAKPGLDGHDVGAKVVVRALMEAGFEVIYTGLRKTPEEILELAAEQQVDVMGLSILSGSHLSICDAISKLLPEYNTRFQLWLVGGNIPAKDEASLKEMGVTEIFPFSTKFETIADYINEKVS